MALPNSLWLLSVCLLSWCCDAQDLELSDLESKSDPLPLVIWSEIENSTIVNTFKNFIEKQAPGIYVLPLKIGKNIMKDVENQVLDASSQVCEILAQDPKLQDGYIFVTFSKGLKFLRSVAQRCPIPVMRRIIYVSARKFLRYLKKLF
ncbi:palmitoyl-protein thioesterase 1-like [Arvicanthis niloticus]|uniref:palmitoyl-protein thioesterase 1-like n=1 Tax=Arvicanthis niloticus TaxID=61156 RepID=UPI001486D84F|nr:palmitoyl-protein thioesterase 1-like [Arvicanthis niloticus]